MPDRLARHGSPAASSDRSCARLETVTLAAYRAALARADWRLDEPNRLLEQLGGVDLHAGHPDVRERLAVAGRLIAVAQLAGPRLPESAVREAIRGLLGQSAGEWDDAAPSLVSRAASRLPASGLDASMLDCRRDGGLTRVAWRVAAFILRHQVRPEIPLGLALDVGAALGPLGAEAAAVLSDPSPFGLRDAPLDGLLLHLATRARCGMLALSGHRVAWEESAERDWVHIAAAAAGSHARWTGGEPAASLRHAIARAIERLAASLVPDHPRRFPQRVALAHAERTAFEAAVSALGTSLHPGDELVAAARIEALDGLLEAAGSGLIGAWVARRLLDG